MEAMINQLLILSLRWSDQNKMVVAQHKLLANAALILSSMAVIARFNDADAMREVAKLAEQTADSLIKSNEWRK
jgi:hypothetical protein